MYIRIMSGIFPASPKRRLKCSPKLRQSWERTRRSRSVYPGRPAWGWPTIWASPLCRRSTPPVCRSHPVLPGTDVVIELGGEDAKILFLSGGMEVRMNGSCAGGTGAFIDQMATLAGRHAGRAERRWPKPSDTIYTIASRCGVFAKSDIQPLLNQGARSKTTSPLSILTAVVNQTIAGLAQGREIEGKVVYLGGPLTFFSELRGSFDRSSGRQRASARTTRCTLWRWARPCPPTRREVRPVRADRAGAPTTASKPSIPEQRSPSFPRRRGVPGRFSRTARPEGHRPTDAGYVRRTGRSTWASTPAPPPSRPWPFDEDETIFCPSYTAQQRQPGAPW